MNTKAKSKPEGEEETIILVEEPEELEELEADLEATEAANTLEDVINQLGGDSTIDIMLKVYRKHPDTGVEEFCFNAASENLPLEPRLINQYGYGEFKIKVYAPTPKGGKSVKKVVIINIAKSLIKETEKTSENSTDLMDSFAKIMAKQNETMITFMREHSLAQENTILKIMMEQGKNKSDQPTMTEMLDIFSRLQGDKIDPMEQITKLLGVTNEIKEFTTPEEQTGFGVFSKGLESLTDLMKIQQNNPTQPAQQIASNSPPINAPAIAAQPIQNTAPVNITEPDTMNPIVKATLRKQLIFLCAQATAGRDAALYADVVVDQIPAQFITQLYELMLPDSPTAIAKLAKIHEEVAKHYDWFHVLCDNIRDQLAPENTLTNINKETINAEDTGLKSDQDNNIDVTGQPDAHQNENHHDT